jgi:hypothetical protein
MKSVCRLAAVSAAIVSICATLAGGANAAEKIPAPLQTLFAGPPGPVTSVEPDVTLERGTRAVTINVTYHGFSTAARASFQRAVNIWAKTLTSSVPITVDATFKDLGNPHILGQAGPSSLWRDFSGAPRSNTFYVDAVANKNHGSQLDPSPDIVASFNSTFPNWHFDKTAAPPNTYDFETVVLHELGHGVGFLGAGNVRRGQGTVRLGSYPTAYDLFTEDKSGKKLTTYANKSTALGNALVSGNIFYGSKRVRNAFGGNRARLFAPNPFQPGSSYSHLDEATFPAGDPNSLMTPQLGQGETIRSVGGIVKAVLKDEGWN